MGNNCETCIHKITYEECDDNLNTNTDKQIHVCMLTDAEIELNETCDDYENYCQTCMYDGQQETSIRCALCNNGSGYYPNNEDRLVIEL